MNLFLDYQKKIFDSIRSLEKKETIVIPSKLKSFTVELPPKNQKADISCNAAMILAKINNTSPVKLAEILNICRDLKNHCFGPKLAEILNLSVLLKKTTQKCQVFIC